MKYFLIVLLCSVAMAQSSVVVELPKTDSMTAKTLYEAKTKADKDWEDFLNQIKKATKFDNLDFSTDFRFVVPKPYQGSGTATWGTNCCPYYSGNLIVANPASCGPCSSFVLTPSTPSTTLTFPYNNDGNLVWK